jgi:hypothetical protein
MLTMVEDGEKLEFRAGRQDSKQVTKELKGMQAAGMAQRAGSVAWERVESE